MDSNPRSPVRRPTVDDIDELSENVLTALNGAKDALVESGARLVPVDFPAIAGATTAWVHLCLGEAAIAGEREVGQREFLV
jgi:hypothetical protein